MNVSASKEDRGGREQMGIHEAGFFPSGKKMMAVQEGKKEQRESRKSRGEGWGLQGKGRSGGSDPQNSQVPRARQATASLTDT